MANTESPLCVRCTALPSTHMIRNERLCTDCFLKYISTKVIKRMEAARVRGSYDEKPRRLLLALSGGSSSVSLLHILDAHISGQVKKSARPRYELLVVHVKLEGGQEVDIERLRRRFPRHVFEVVLPEQSNVALSTSKAETKIPLQSLTSPTSRADLASITLRNTLLSHASRRVCAGILIAQSTTSLAESILSATAKGRGSSLPWLASDNEDPEASPYGVAVYYPMRDVLRKELLQFVRVSALEDCIVQESEVRVGTVNSKDKTIDDLMRGYFASVEEGFPSVVANVVRTCGKLQPPIGMERWERCHLCKLPFEEEGNAGGALDTRRAGEDGGLGMCYGCRQSVISGA